MTCHYCGDPSTREVDALPICYDCQQRAGDAPAEDRFAVILNSLNTLHGRLLAIGVSSVSEWVDRLAKRIEVCRRGGLLTDLADAVSAGGAEKAADAFIAAADTAQALVSGAMAEHVKRKKTGAIKLRK